MSGKLLTEHYLELLSLKGGYTGSPESTLVKMPHCWKSHVTAQIVVQPDLKPRWALEEIWVLSYPLSTQQRLGSADLSLRCAQNKLLVCRVQAQ